MINEREEWIQLAQNRNQFRALISTLVTFGFGKVLDVS